MARTAKRSAAMTKPPVSYWVASTPETRFPHLAGKVSVDVAVVGGGIAGITAATLLHEAGSTVALLDSKRILRGATGYTTAKLTSGHGLLYGHLIERFGEEKARFYAEAQQWAIERVAELVERHGIDCDFRRQPNYVYADERDERASIEQEVEAARRVGLPASFVEDPPLPFATRGAIRLDGQAEFHPRKFLLPLAERIPGSGSDVFEETRALRVEEDGGRCRVETREGSIDAGHVLVLTQIPFLDRGLFFTRVHPYRAYVIAAPIDEEKAPEGMFVTSKSPTRSIRTTAREDGLLLFVGGEGHKTGTDPHNERRFETLEAFLHDHFDAGPVEYRWATQDYFSVDRVPFVGPLTPLSKRVYVATGFGGWGMTNGIVAAKILADAVLGNDNDWAGVFSSRRLNPRAGAVRFVTENADVAKHWVADRLTVPERKPIDELAPGDASVLRIGDRRVAVHRDESGELHAVSAVCSHLGCVLGWNAAERSWDCPCHGSRFATDGKVIQGPAIKDLRRLDPGTLR